MTVKLVSDAEYSEYVEAQSGRTFWFMYDLVGKYSSSNDMTVLGYFDRLRENAAKNYRIDYSDNISDLLAVESTDMDVDGVASATRYICALGKIKEVAAA